MGIDSSNRVRSNARDPAWGCFEQQTDDMVTCTPCESGPLQLLRRDKCLPPTSCKSSSDFFDLKLATDLAPQAIVYLGMPLQVPD